MKYYINGSKEPSSYIDVLDFVCLICTSRESDRSRYYWSVPVVRKFDASAFYKGYRHNDNDGTWSSFRWQYKYDWFWVVDEETGKGEYIKEKVDQILIPPQLTQKQHQIKDEYGRILNSKDLVKDAMQHDYDPERKIKERRRLYRQSGYYHRCSTSRYQKGRNWQRYKGTHSGPVTVKKSFIYAETDQKESSKKYGVTFKIRNKRKKHFMDLWDFKHGWLEKGWKQTRKKKQWMRKDNPCD